MTFHDDIMRTPRTLTSIPHTPGNIQSLTDNRSYGTVLHLRTDTSPGTGTSRTAINSIGVHEGQEIELQSIGKPSELGVDDESVKTRELV